MRVLAVCNYGQNRSRYLAEQLAQRGIEADFAGVKATPPAEMQRKIDAADTIITLEPAVRRRLEKEYRIEGKRVLGLNVAFRSDSDEMRREIDDQIEERLSI